MDGPLSSCEIIKDNVFFKFKPNQVKNIKKREQNGQKQYNFGQHHLYIACFQDIMIHLQARI
jgi:hypothetical protein